MKKKLGLSIIALLLLNLMLSLSSNPALVQARPSPIDPELAKVMAQASSTDQLDVIVFLADELDTTKVSGRNKDEKQKNIIEQLRKKSDDTQVVIRRLLKDRQVKKEVTKFTPIWLRNAVALTATKAIITEAAKLPEVGKIVQDATFFAPQVDLASAPATVGIENNISLVNAPDLWNLGYQGQNVVVASFDTGVDYTHPELQSRWRGGSDSWYDPYAQHDTPFDKSGHGTWTMGVIVGGNAGGTSIGVAPQAQWIAAKIFNDLGKATASSIHLAYQWALNPGGNPAVRDAPQVINNSWSYNAIGCSLEFAQDITNLQAAGISQIYAAGNYGPNSSTGSSPANNPGAFSVGEINNSSLVVNNSSRGPNSCGVSTPVTYPDIVAPGLSIHSTDLYGFYSNNSGTSLSAPHVTGAVALLLSAFPNLTPAQLKAALISTANDLGVAGADNAYGAGRLNILAAYNRLNGATPTPTATATIGATATATATPVTPTATATPVTPTATATPVAPTATATTIPTATATATATATSTATATPTATTTPVSGTIFSDGFEAGNAAVWASSTGPISVTNAAALSGNYGLQAVLSGNTPGYVVSNSPANELNYNARFYFNPNNTGTGTGQHDIFSGSNSAAKVLFRVQYRKTSTGVLQVRGLVVDINSVTTSTNWYTISNAAHAVEISWHSAGSASFSLYIDGTVKQTLSGLNTSGYLLKQVRLGPSASLNSSTTGTEYFDNFSSTRGTFIGL